MPFLKTKPLKKKSQVIVRLCIGSISLLFGILVAVLFIDQQYFSVDARYARDNLHFLVSEMTDRDMAEYQKTPVIQEPLITTITRLIAYKTIYTSSWSLEEAQATPDDQYENPLNIMVLDANDDDIQAIYDEFRYTAALMNLSRHGLLTSDMVDSWHPYIAASNNGYQNLISTCRTVVAVMITTLLFGIWNVVIPIIQLRRYHVMTHSLDQTLGTS